MPRINTYALDDDLHVDDKVIGTDSTGLGTKNFKLAEIAEFFSQKGLITVGSQSIYKFATIERSDSTFSLQSLGGNGTNFSDITSLKFSGIDSRSIDIAQFLLAYKSKKILIAQLNNKNNFGIYDAANVAADANNTGYYDFTLTEFEGNGSLIADEYYAICILGPKNHSAFNFSTSDFNSQSENINGSNMRFVDFTHNMKKYPSITVTETGSEDQVAHVPVKYISKNIVRVYFTGLTNGTIYAN
jgi:hypothetical protein